jgi:hypothetical protein
VVRADWTEDDLVGLLETDDDLVGLLETDDGSAPNEETYRGRTQFVSGGTAAATLGDTEFAVGTTATAKRLVDDWHGDAEPVGGTTLDSFERIPSRAVPASRSGPWRSTARRSHPPQLESTT